MSLLLACKTHRKWLRNCKNQVLLEKRNYTSFAAQGLIKTFLNSQMQRILQKSVEVDIRSRQRYSKIAEFSSPSTMMGTKLVNLPQPCIWQQSKFLVEVNILFAKNILNPQVKIYNMLNEHSADYHNSPSELTSRIHSLIFLQPPQDFQLSPE